MESLSPDEWEELMSEPPGGGNHGRMRGAEGGWHELDEVAQAVWDADLQIIQGWIHGTRTTYVEGCRCPSCRRANRDYHRKLRSGKLPDASL